MVLLVALGVFAVSLVPYLLAYATTPSDKVFNGFFYVADDAATYISKMREGADGAWGWSDPYISSPVAQPVGLFLFYIAWGKVAALLHLPLIAVYHIARFTGAVVLVAAARALARVSLPPGRARNLGLLLALVGSGAGYLVALLHQPLVLGERLEALDLHLPELSGFYSLLTFPHFAWAAALMAIAVVALIGIAGAPDDRRLMRAVLGATVAAALLCVIHPQMLFVLAPLAFLNLVLRRAPPSRWMWTAVPFVLCAPLVYYYLRVLTDDPVIVEWARQWKHQAPGPLSFLIALGLPLLLAAVSLAGARRRSPEVLLLAAWVALVVALLYIPNPVNIQRRLTDGIYLPVGMLAALGVDRVAAWRAGPRSWGRSALMVASVSAISSLLVLAIGIFWGLSRQPFIYLGRGEVAAMSWLESARGQGLTPAVLSDPDTGLQIPPRAGDHVYVGHYSETIDFSARARTARAAISGDGEPLAEFMRAQGVTYLFFGPRERALGGPDPSTSGGLRVVYGHDEVSIFALSRP
jgi:hypothetical protein